jgi:D-hydroxyproline dehydrogenase subunit gamma
MTATRLPGYRRGAPFEIEVDGHRLMAHEGETVATVLLCSGIRSFHNDSRGGEPSRLFCGMGVCLQCLATIDGLPGCQTCRTLARPGMKVETGA